MATDEAALRARVTPERIALVGVVLMGFALIASGPQLGQPGGAASGTTSSPVRTIAPSSSPVPDATLIAGAIELNGQLLDLQASLKRELASKPIDGSAIIALLRQVDITARTASQAATHLELIPGIRQLAVQLTTAYGQIDVDTQAALRGPSGDLATLQKDTATVITACTPLVTLTADLRTLVPQAPASPGPSATGFLNQLLDPGFESAVGSPWKLGLTGGAWATITSDLVTKVGGTASARVDITTPSTSWSGIDIAQGGLQLAAGGRYAASIAIRAAQPRDVRLRIVSQAGETYATRIVTATPTWTTATFDFIALAADPNAIFEVDLGHSAVTVWLDNAAFGEVAPSAP